MVFHARAARVRKSRRIFAGGQGVPSSNLGIPTNFPAGVTPGSHENPPEGATNHDRHFNRRRLWAVDDAPPKRPRGRPRVGDEGGSVSVHVRIATKQYDRLYQEASTERVSLADLIRTVIAARLRRP